MMNDNPQPPGEPRSEGMAVPPLVNRVLVLFYILTLVNFLYSVLIAFQDAGGDYGFLVPACLYMLLFAAHFVLNLLQYRQRGGMLADVLWGYDEPAWRPLAFILVGFALIFWMNLESDAFIWQYIPWIAATFGMFPVRLSLPILALEVSGLIYQIGIVEFLGGEALPLEALIGISFSILSFVISFVLITLLIRERIASEHLVHRLKRTQAQLEEASHKEKEVAVLRERDRMAREMHDVLGHSLVLVAVKIEAAQRLQAVNPERAAEELESTKELVRQSMADLRASLADLRNPAFEADDKPLKEALQEWAERIAREGKFKVECDFEPGIETLPPAIQAALWRVGREAILNIVKHARATGAHVSLFRKDGEIYLTVMDDGVGIPHLAEGSARLEVEGHYGIRGMRERLEALGGHLRLTPGRDGKGTLVIATIPLPPEAASEHDKQASLPSARQPQPSTLKLQTSNFHKDRHS
jgi:signal transduction histidine kinase